MKQNVLAQYLALGISRRRRARPVAAVLSWAGVCLLSVNAFAQPTLDAYTSVAVRANIAGGVSILGDTTPNGPTSFSADFEYDPTFSTPGYVSGGGYASFTSLGAWVQIEGAAARSGEAIATNNEAFNIAPPFGAQIGDSAEMIFQIAWDGISSINSPTQGPIMGFAGGWNTVLGATKWPGDGTSGQTVGRDVIGDDYVPNPGGGVVPTISNHYSYFTVPFEYGEQFGLSISLRTLASMGGDIVDVEFDPYFETYGQTSIESIFVDFSNTAELVAIIVPDSPDAQLIGASGMDYSSLVTATALPEVPIPAAGWLFGSSLLALIAAARRRRKINRGQTTRL